MKTPKPPERCPECGAVRVRLEDAGRDEREHRYVWTCAECGEEIADAGGRYARGRISSTEEDPHE